MSESVRSSQLLCHFKGAMASSSWRHFWPAADAPPGPRLSRRPSRLLAWQGIAPKLTAYSCNYCWPLELIPLYPPPRPWVNLATPSQLLAIAATNTCLSSNISQKFPSIPPISQLPATVSLIHLSSSFSVLKMIFHYMQNTAPWVRAC